MKVKNPKKLKSQTNRFLGIFRGVVHIGDSFYLQNDTQQSVLKVSLTRKQGYPNSVEVAWTEQPLATFDINPSKTSLTLTPLLHIASRFKSTLRKNRGDSEHLLITNKSDQLVCFNVKTQHQVVLHLLNDQVKKVDSKAKTGADASTERQKNVYVAEYRLLKNQLILTLCPSGDLKMLYFDPQTGQATTFFNFPTKCIHKLKKTTKAGAEDAMNIGLLAVSRDEKFAVFCVNKKTAAGECLDKVFLCKLSKQPKMVGVIDLSKSGLAALKALEFYGVLDNIILFTGVSGQKSSGGDRGDVLLTLRYDGRRFIEEVMPFVSNLGEFSGFTAGIVDLVQVSSPGLVAVGSDGSMHNIAYEF